MPEIPNLTSQITRPIDGDVTGPTPDSERCIWRTQSSEVDVRVKKLFKSKSDWQHSSATTAASSEIVQWHKVRHSNVVSVFGIIQRDLTPFLVTPWIAGGNLNAFLTQHDQLLSPIDCMSLIRDVAAGLHCLHSLSIVHGSLVGANILVDNGRRACLTDFGLASIREPIKGSELLRRSSDAPGAIRWTATEIIVRDVERPTIHSDIYSFGSAALQIITGRVPWSELEDDVDVVVKLSQGLVPWKPEDCLVKDSLWAFIQRCWEFVPEDRPTSSDALDFAEIEFRATLNCEGYQATQPSQGAPAYTLVSARSTAIGTSPSPSRVVLPSITVPLNTVGSVRPVRDASAPLTLSMGIPAVENELLKPSKTTLAMTSNRVVSTSTSPEPPTGPGSSIISTTATSTPSGLFKIVDIAKSFLNSSSPSLQSSSEALPTTSAQPCNLLHHQPSLPIPQPSSNQGAHLYASFVPGMYREQQDAGTQRPSPFTCTVVDVPMQHNLGASVEDPSEPPIPASPRMAPYPDKAPPACMAPQVPMQLDGEYYSHSTQSPTVPIPSALPVGTSGRTASILIEIEEVRCKREVEEIREEERKRSETKRKVTALLNKLTMERFDSISDQIIEWANKSVNENDGRTLIQVVQLTFEKAVDEAAWSEKYARLYRKMMDQISPDVQDDEIRNQDGKPVAGGLLFRKYLLNRCQEDFERVWFTKEATAVVTAKKKKGTEEAGLYSNESYAAQKAKRRGLGLIKFIGELFKLQMLTERIMHECVKKLLGNAENPEEGEIESLCQLLTTAGQLLDTPKARAHMDVYFTRMKELGNSTHVSSRMQIMLQDVIELRERKWISPNVTAASTTIAAIHEAAAKNRAIAEKESYIRQASMSSGGSRRGGERNQEFAPDGWTVTGGSVSRPPPNPKAADLSQFGKISKGAPMITGPSSVFTGGKKDNKRETLSRTNSNSFPMLSQNLVRPAKAGVPEPPVQRKKLKLLPRSRPTAEENTLAHLEEEPEKPPMEMSEADAKKKIDKDVKEFFAVRNLEEADVYFTHLPDEYHFRLVDRLVGSALKSKEADARLVGEFFTRAASNGQCTLKVFEEGFMLMVEFLDDIAIDAPNAFVHMAIMLKGARFEKEPERLRRIASKLEDGDKLISLMA